MEKLKKAYDIKRQMISDINELGNVLKENNSIETININPDNTIYLESNSGIDSIKNNLDESIKKMIMIEERVIRSMILNTLPLSNNSCIVRI